MSKESFRADPERDAKDAKAITLQTEKINAISLRAFNKNAGQIKLGQTYSVSDLEFIFNIRIGEQLRNNLANRFEYTSNKDGTFTFTKDKEAQV
jgi:hypothetical protein